MSPRLKEVRKQINRQQLSFDGNDSIDFEDADSTLHFFFPKDYAYAAADSVTDFANRVSLRRYLYSDRGKDYMLVGVPWTRINSAPTGDLIIDPTTPVTNSDDVRLYDGANYGTSTILAVGKNPSGGTLKARTLIKFNLSGISSSATVLRATMNLRYYEAVNYGGGTWVDRWVQVHQLLGINFAELEATRDNRTIDLPWNAPYAAIDGTDAKATMESTLLFWQSELSELPKWKSWDLTALTQKWLNTPANNYGVILWATNEDVAGYTMRFYSSEADSANRPYLEVVYSTDTATTTVYFLKDHLGSIRATVDAAGTVIGYDDYDPYGYPLTLRTKKTPYDSLQKISKNKFTGKESDDEYGLNWNYFGARYYDPQIGRWPTVDPLWLKHPDVSPYNYVLNNPLAFIDPNGKQRYYVHALYKPPSAAEIKQNFLQSIEVSKLLASAGLYKAAGETLIGGALEAWFSMESYGISGHANPMAIMGVVEATTTKGTTGLKLVLTKSGEIDKRTKLARELAKKLENLTTETKDVTQEIAKMSDALEGSEKLAGSKEAEDLLSAIETTIKSGNVKQGTKSFFRKIIDIFKREKDEIVKETTSRQQ